MAEIVLALFLISAVVVLTAVSRRLGASTPITMVVGGLLLTFLPGLPDFKLPPDLVFFGFLPPLVFAGGYFTSLRDFRSNLRAIVLLAVGLVRVREAKERTPRDDVAQVRQDALVL